MNVSLLSISSCLMFFSSPHLQRSFAEKFSDDAVAGDNFSTGHEDAPPWTLFQILRWSSEGSKDFSNLTCVDSLPKLTLQVRFFQLKFGRFDYSVLPSYLAAYFQLHNRELLEHNFAVPCTATINTLESLNCPEQVGVVMLQINCQASGCFSHVWMFSFSKREFLRDGFFFFFLLQIFFCNLLQQLWRFTQNGLCWTRRVIFLQRTDVLLFMFDITLYEWDSSVISVCEQPQAKVKL